MEDNPFFFFFLSSFLTTEKGLFLFFSFFFHYRNFLMRMWAEIVLLGVDIMSSIVSDSFIYFCKKFR